MEILSSFKFNYYGARGGSSPKSDRLGARSATRGKVASAKREVSGGPEPPENFLGPRPLHRRKRPIWRTAVKEHPIQRPTVKDVQGQNIT